MTHFENYDLEVVNIAASQENKLQYNDQEICKIGDPTIKVFFVVTPGNPTRLGIISEATRRS